MVAEMLITQHFKVLQPKGVGVDRSYNRRSYSTSIVYTLNFNLDIILKYLRNALNPGLAPKLHKLTLNHLSKSQFLNAVEIFFKIAFCVAQDIDLQLLVQTSSQPIKWLRLGSVLKKLCFATPPFSRTQPSLNRLNAGKKQPNNFWKK